MIKKTMFIILSLALFWAIGHIGAEELSSRSEVTTTVTAVVDCQLTGGLTYVQTPDNHVWAYYDFDDLRRGDRVYLTICNGEIIDSEVLR